MAAKNQFTITINPKIKTHLPNEIIFLEILPKIPAIHLLQFKSVHKKWRKLISSNPHFIKTHLHYWTSQSPGTLKPKDFVDMKLNQMLNDKNTLLPITSKYGLLLIQSVNWSNPLGSLPLFYVCNPVTRQSLRLPVSPFLLNPVEIVCDGVSMERFKVVSWSSTLGICVYTLGSGEMSWRLIPNPSGVYEMYGRVVFVDGSLYWVAMTVDRMCCSFSQCTTLNTCVVRLDVHTEDVKVIRMVDEYHDKPPVLVEFRGVLHAVFDSECGLESFVIWVLDDWKSNTTWRKILRCKETSSLYGSVGRIVGMNKLRVHHGILVLPVWQEKIGYGYCIDHVNTLVSWDGNAFRKKRKWISRRCLKIIWCFLLATFVFICCTSRA